VKANPADYLKFSVEIKGLRELDQQLKMLEPNVRKRLGRAALKAGAKLILAKAKMNAPVATGKLRDSLVVKSGRTRKPNTVNVLMMIKEGWYKGETFYGAFVEFGTRHAPAHPFMRPAFDTEKDAALAAITRKLAEGLEKKLGSLPPAE